MVFSPSTQRWVLIAAISASSIAFLEQSALNLALPTIQEELNATAGEILWAVNAYLVFLSALILVGGALGDLLGRKRVFMAGIGLFSFGLFLGGISPSIEVLIGARVVQGVGGALMVPGSLSLLSATYPPEIRGGAIGTWSAASTLTTLLGPILGGELVNAGYWRGVFFIGLPLAGFALLILLLKVPESRDENAPPRLDLWGALFATLGLAGLTIGLIEAPERGLTAPLVLVALGGGLAALVAFVRVEMTTPHAMVPPHLFASRTFTGTNLMTFFLYGALGGALFFLPLLLIQVQGYPADVAGRALLPFGVTLVFMSRWAGRWSDRVGVRLPLTLGSTLVGLGFLALALPPLDPVTEGSYYLRYAQTYLGGVLLVGVGMGLVVAPLTTAVMGAVSQTQAGVASGVNNAVARSANVVAIAVFGAVALVTFGGRLDARTASLDLDPDTQSAVKDEVPNLGGAEAPAALPPDQRQAIQTRMDWAFVDTFRVISVLGAVLCFISAGLSWGVLRGRAQMLEAHI